MSVKSRKKLPKPIVVPTNYDYDTISNLETAIEEVLYEELQKKQSGNVLFDGHIPPILTNYPVVYVISAQKSESEGRKYIAYVGETNDIHQRSLSHYNTDPKTRSDFQEFKELSQTSQKVTQYIIGHEHFNKSLTLDIENKIIEYFLCIENIEKCNRRGNVQGNYYTKDEFNDIFQSIWKELHQQDKELFPSLGIILDSALFKASPFHELTKSQQTAEDRIIKLINNSLKHSKTDVGNIIFVHGAAGTGKTVLLSHLFDRLVERENFNTQHIRQDDKTCYLLVNHEQQLNVYSQIAKKLGWHSKDNEVVMKPVSFIRKYSETVHRENKDRDSYDVNSINGKTDVAVIDEAHLLLTQKNQAYLGTNMLLDIAKRAKVTVAVFDPNQVLQSNQRWSDTLLTQLGLDGVASQLSDNSDINNAYNATIDGSNFSISHIYLNQQMRMNADEQTIAWVDNLVVGNPITPLPKASPVAFSDEKSGTYEIRVFDSPRDLFTAIKEKAKTQTEGREGKGISRVVATYDWPYTGTRKNDNDPTGLWNVCMKRSADGIWRPSSASNIDLTLDEYQQLVENDSREDVFCHPWNYEYEKYKGNKTNVQTHEAWAEKDVSLYEVGSTFSIQGFDLNYVGVIIGPSFGFDVDKQTLTIRPSHSQSKKATAKRESKFDYSIENLRNELNVLLTRGVHGLYLFAVDPALQHALKAAVQQSNVQVPSLSSN